jgi:hypothetical protein
MQLLIILKPTTFYNISNPLLILLIISNSCSAIIIKLLSCNAILYNPAMLLLIILNPTKSSSISYFVLIIVSLISNYRVKSSRISIDEKSCNPIIHRQIIIAIVKMSWSTFLIEQSHSSKSLNMQSQIGFTTIMFEGKKMNLFVK